MQRIRFVEYTPKSVTCTAPEDSDRGRLAVCREDGSIEIWCTVPSSFLRWNIDFVIPGRVERSIDSVTWCRSRLFTAGLEGELVEWDLENLAQKNTADACGGPVWCVAGSHDKSFVAAGCEDGSVRLFDIQFGGLELAKTLDRQDFRVLSLAWSKCDTIIVTGSTDSTIRVYDVATRHIVSRISTDKIKEKNTLIWSIYLTSDMTIISGDSLGQTQFWDAKMGTLLNSFKSHEADVLALCVSENEDSVYSSGIDSRVAEFKCETDKDTSGGEWRLTRKLRSVNHDVRALSLTGGKKDCLIVGGIDPRLSVFDISRKSRSAQFLSIFPDSPPCCLAKNKNVLVFHEANKVHVWKLPFLDGKDEESQIPNKLLELKSSRDDYITCADISTNGDILICADINCVFGYALSYNVNESLRPEIQVAKIKFPKGSFQGTQKIKLLPDGSRAVLAASKGIGVINICDKGQNNTSFESTRALKGPWCLLEVDETGSYAAAANFDNEIFVFCLKRGALLCTVPQSSSNILAIKFQPQTNRLVFVGAQKEIHIYDFISEKFDDWTSHANQKELLKNLTTKGARFINIAFDQQDSSIVFLQWENGFVKMKIGAEQSLVRAGMKRKHQDKKDSFFNSVTKYSPLLYLDTTKENCIVVVECPLDRILNALPPALKVKRFGR